MDNLFLQSFTFGFDPKLLPDLVNSVEILAEIDLSNTRLSGILESTGGCPEDMNDDGTVNGAVSHHGMAAAWGHRLFRAMRLGSMHAAWFLGFGNSSLAVYALWVGTA